MFSDSSRCTSNRVRCSNPKAFLSRRSHRLSANHASPSNFVAMPTTRAQLPCICAAMLWRARLNGSPRSSPQRETPTGLIATVGKIEVEPNASNVIAGTARASLDVRHADDSSRKSAVESLLANAQAIAEKRGLALEWTQQMDQPAVPMDERLTAYLADAISSRGPARRSR